MIDPDDVVEVAHGICCLAIRGDKYTRRAAIFSVACATFALGSVLLADRQPREYRRSRWRPRWNNSPQASRADETTSVAHARGQAAASYHALSANRGHP